MRWLSKKTGQIFSSTQKVMSRVVGILKGKKRLEEADLMSLRHALIDADVGLALTNLAIDHLQQVCAQGVENDDTLIEALKDFLVSVFPSKPLLPTVDTQVIMIVGVNGVGKTTTIGKLSQYFYDKGQTVAVAPGDTFRAAAEEQLQYWADKTKAQYVTPPNTKDPAAVIFDALQAAQRDKTNILLADTAGRMHSNQGLMEQLKKVKRVMGKLDETAPHAVWLVLDGSLGQSNIEQAKLFHEALGVTGVIVTKVDGSAKGGAVFSVAKMGLPICFVGSGEGVKNLVEFDPRQFVDEILSD